MPFEATGIHAQVDVAGTGDFEVFHHAAGIVGFVDSHFFGNFNGLMVCGVGKVQKEVMHSLLDVVVIDIGQLTIHLRRISR